MPANRQTSPVGPGPNGESQPTGTPTGYISPKFDVFTSAGTFKHVLSSYRQITDLLQLTPAPINQFYPKLKAKLDTWKARNLWAKLDKRAAQKEYQKGRACENTRVLIIGAGPVGLRTAIEAQLLGAKVVVIEKRDRFSRNNVLHLWPFVISDLRQLGAKKFFGKFCAGSIDHISIRQLQLILLKVCLLLGVEIHENVTFEGLVEPAEIDGVKTGWRALLSPSGHEASNYEFDFLVCADGKRNTIQGFARNEFRGKLAIGITANFINRQTQEENKVPEISGVTFIFNQKFFRDMQMVTGIDLENIVYYKDDTHYFVMTAKKQSLIERRVIINDYGDVANLLKPENVNNAALLEYASDAARFATKNQLPNLEFAVNHFGRPDVAMFDFTSMFASENASRMVERQGKKLLLCLVGDSLLEPFWPTGSGCARGFLSALDTAWMMKAWESQPPVKVIAERESIYRLLNQTKPENINKDFNHYTINPATRYMNLGEAKVLPGEVTHLCDMETMTFEIPDTEMQMTSMARKRIRNRSIVNPDSLQLWCERQVYQYDIRVDDMTSCWRDGRALTAILHRYRPELIGHPNEINPTDVAANCQRVFDLFEKEYGIPPVMTGADMEASEVPDKLTMVSYLTQVYEIFRGAIPRTGRPVCGFADLLEEHESSRPSAPRPNLRAAVEEYGGSGTLRDGRSKSVYDEPNLATDETSTPEAAKRSKLTERAYRSRAHLEAMMRGHGGVRSEMVSSELERVVDTMDKRAFSARKERIQEQFKLDSTGQRPLNEQPGHSQVSTRKSLGGQRPTIRELQKQLLDLEKGRVKKDGPPGHYVGKIGKDDWNVRLLEERLKEREKGTKAEKKKVEKPQVDTLPQTNQLGSCENYNDVDRLHLRENGQAPKERVFEELFRDKRSQMEGRLRGEAPERAKYGVIDEQLQRVERQLKDGGAIMDAGERGRNKVAQLKNMLDVKAQQNRPLHRLNPPKVNKYLRRDHNKDHDTSGSSSTTSYEDLPGSSSGGSCELEIAAFRTKTPPIEAGPDIDADACVRSQSPPVQESSDLCYFCGQRVYLIDRLSAEGHFFHRSCLRCEYCNENLRIGSYAYDTSGVCKGKFFCVAHFRMERPSERWSQMMRRKEAFLQEEPRPAQILPKTEEPKREELPKSSTPIRMTPDHTLRPGISSSLIDINRDRTPERAEFENLGDASELDQDDFLNSELEEEELTQRNLGATEVQTDDDIENLSTDEDEDEMMVQVAVQVGEDEQLHRSLTADATRHLAETWSKKHNQSCCDSSETTDDESSTEKDEGATTDDVDSDYEYASDSHPSQAGASQSLKGDTDSKSAGTHDEISDGTEGDYSTIRRKKPAGVPKVSPLVIDSTKKLRDTECQEQDEEDAEDEGNSTEDLLTLSITDSSGEEEGPYDEGPKSPKQVPAIVVDEEVAPQKSGDELWGEHGIREVLSLTGCSMEGSALSGAAHDRQSHSGAIRTPSETLSPPDDGSGPGAAMSASLTEVTEFGAELSSDTREESDNKDDLSRRSNESKESKDSHRSNPRVPPRASCDQIKGHQSESTDRRAPPSREEKTEDETSESSVTNTLDASPAGEPLNLFGRPNSLLRSESDTQMISVNDDKEPSPVSLNSAPSASIASPDSESISRLDDDFPIVKMINDGMAPVATLETSDEEDLTVSEWAKEGSEHLSTVEDLNIQQRLQPLSGVGKLKKGYTFHLSGSRADQRESEERDRTPTNSMDELNVNSTPLPRKPLAQTLSSGGSQPKNNINFLDNYRTLPFKTHSSLLGNPLERSSSANRIDEAAKKAAEKKSPPPKFSGYGGSFAEKVRRPTESDSIYLKSLNIKLKKVDFPSIRSANSSQKGSQDDLLSDEESDSVFRRPGELQKSATSPSVLDHNKNLHVTLSAAKPKRNDDLGSSPGRISQVSQVLARDPVAALTQLKAANEASVYENVNNLPYFDDRASLASFKIDTANNPQIESGFLTPTCDQSNKGQPAKDPWRIRTGSVSSVCSIDRERARQEARERAKLKSDAELGISPPSAYLRRHRGRLGSEDGNWETPQRGAHPRPQSEYIERTPDPDMLPTYRASSQKPVIESTRQTSSKSSKTPAVASAKKRLFSSGENSPPKTAAPQSRPSSAGNKAKNALFSLLNFGSKNSSGGSSSASPDNKANGGDAKPTTSNQGHQKSGLSKSPSSKTILASKLKILSPKTSKSPRGSVTSVDSRDTVDSRGMKKNVSVDSLKSSGASPAASNAGNANSTRSTANTSKASSEFSVDLSAMSGSIHEMRLGSMGMSTLISGTDLLCESDDNEPFPDVQDILSDKRVEADKAEKFQQRVYKQQELKRIRIAQEVQRKLEEIEVARAGIEARGVDVEKELRRCAVAAEKEALSQELFQLMRQKNKLNRQEQELLIRAKDLELENRHAKLQKEMRDRMAIEDSKKSPKDVEDERVILREMLEILEKRDKLVVLLDQLELKQQREEREMENRMRAAQQQGVPIVNTISASNV